ncbi:response regulator transcription factor [Acidicapsa ligni]|uniref:response regulator transcription factor n=1 Tax=Acidicapsa ligni TaxID=542300 RepID=UPI0021E08929|nr:LuxR C-terminal-related transcriptional regulator [Acidicapsa ligni]
MYTSHTVHISGLTSECTKRLEKFLTAQHLSVMHHADIEDFFSTPDEAEASCLITNLHPEHDSISVTLRRLAERPAHPTVILVTNSRDISGAVRAMKEGAIEVLEEPISFIPLLSAVYEALERNKQIRGRRFERMELKRRYERLTRREREVLPLVLGGWLVKQGASVLGIANITMQLHRAQIMRKMEANSLADLVRMGVKLGVRHANSFNQECEKGGSYTPHTITSTTRVLKIGREVKVPSSQGR